MPVNLRYYPLADPRGNSIPFDVGDPYGSAIVPVDVTVSDQLTLPADATLAVLYATVDTVVSYGEVDPSATEGSFSAESSIIPASSSIVVLLPSNTIKTLSRDGTSVGKLYINLFNKWQALGKDVQGSNY